MKLRRPWDRSLADCMWLARFTDKTRHYLAGTLEEDFQHVYAHPLATDGAFFTHFELDRDEIIAAVREAGANDEAAIAAWFTARPASSPAKIAAWNQLAPRLGGPGQPMERSFNWAKRRYYGGDVADPRVTSVFSGLAWDEGYLDEMPPL